MDLLEMEVSGGCQCGAVRYRATQVIDSTHICHCRMCQKTVGNLFAALVAVPNDSLQWSRGAASVFRSSNEADRGFCARCGTPLFYRGTGSACTNLTIGSLDQPARHKPRHQEGIESRLPWFSELSELQDQRVTSPGEEADLARSIESSSRQHPDHDTPN